MDRQTQTQTHSFSNCDSRAVSNPRLWQCLVLLFTEMLVSGEIILAAEGSSTFILKESVLELAVGNKSVYLPTYHLIHFFLTLFKQLLPFMTYTCYQSSFGPIASRSPDIWSFCRFFSPWHALFFLNFLPTYHHPSVPQVTQPLHAVSYPWWCPGWAGPAHANSSG